MPQQIKGNENDLISENPEQNKGNPDKKSKESPPKKKEFKIKKRIQASSKKLNHVDIFNNPIYEGLLNQEQNDQNQQNFGPWIHQDFALSNQSVMRNPRVAQNQFQNLMLNQFSQNKNFQQNQASQMVQNVQNISRAASYSQVYLQIPVRSAILQQNENTSISYLPQIRLKKHNQELRLSSLDFSPERKQSKKSLTCNLLPPKLQKHKQLLINRNRSQGQTADLLLYQSLKSSYSSQKLVNKKLLSKPSNVIYNYCYSNNENNMVLNYFKDQNYGLPRKSTYIANKTENNDQILVLKLNRKQIIEGRIFQKYSELENKKKSISKELYEELIRKKNKCK